MISYQFYPKKITYDDDYKTEDVLYLEGELNELELKIRKQELKIDQLSKDKALYNRKTDNLLDFAKEKMYQDLEYQETII